MRKPTSYDIARTAGVSQSTVSFVLNGRTDMPIRESTRERVLKAANDLGYRPNSSARAMQSGKFGCVALLLSTVFHRSVLMEELREGIQDALDEHKLHLMLARLPDTTLTDAKFVPTFLREWSADGLLVNYNESIPQAMAQLLAENNLPYIWLNTRQDSDCVYPDDYQGAREGVVRLIGLGHKRISFVRYTGVTHYSAADRERGYLDAMREHFLEPQIVASKTGYMLLEECDALLSVPATTRSTAFLCYAAAAATTLIHAAARNRLSVPKDFSLVVFAAAVDMTVGMKLDTIGMPYYDMGKTAVDMLTQKIADPSITLAPRILPLVSLPGETVAPPPSDG